MVCLLGSLSLQLLVRNLVEQCWMFRYYSPWTLEFLWLPQYPGGTGCGDQFTVSAQKNIPKGELVRVSLPRIKLDPRSF